MYEQFSQRVRSLRKRLRKTQAQFARDAGVSQATVSRWEAGTQDPETDTLIRLAEMAGEDFTYFIATDHDFLPDRNAIAVPVVGSVAAGQWLESIEWPEDRRFTAYLPLESHLKGIDLIGFRVMGESMNKVYAPGSLLFAASAFSHEFEYESGAHVIVQRVSRDGLYEATVKELVITADNQNWLWPRSDHPEHQAPINPADSSGEVDRIEVIGLVLASIQYEGYDKLHTVDGESHRQRLEREGILKPLK